MDPLKKKLLFILNPKAGTGFTSSLSGLIEKGIDHNHFDAEIIFSDHAGHGIELSRHAAEKKYFAVAAVGGDGTINEIAQSLINTETALAILPCGSGNGFSRHLKIPLKLEKAIGFINQQKIITCDTYTVNGMFGLNIAGIGFDAHVANLFSKSNSRGFKTYFRLTVGEYFKYRNKPVTLTIDNQTYEKEVFIAAFANSTQWGNNARIAPLADLQDGWLDISVIRKMPLYKMAGIVRRLFAGSLKENNYISFFKGKEITVSEKTTGIYLHIDGEPRGLVNKLDIKIVPSSIKVIVP